MIDLRTISPLDMDCVLESLGRTNRLVVAHEANASFGVGAEIVARAADEGFWTLDAPLRRIGTPHVPAPYAPELERAWLPDATRIAGCVREVVAV